MNQMPQYTVRSRRRGACSGWAFFFGGGGTDGSFAGASRSLSLDFGTLALFVAENFVHMHEEETRHNALLWANFSDAELLGIHGALVASLTPAEQQQSMRWMLPSVSHAERVELLGGMRKQAPAPVFTANLELACALLSPRDWRKLEASGFAAGVCAGAYVDAVAWAENVFEIGEASPA